MSRRPLAIDLYAGLGGWTEGLLLEGYRVVGFDIDRHQYGEAQYPAQLVLQDVTTIHGAQFKDAALIVASPPCQAYSYRAMPWKRAKALPPPDNTLFEACFRIQREACAAAGHHIPLVVENVCGAQKWVGRARWHYGSFYLWGDVPALMPITKRAAFKGGDRNIGRANGTHQWNTEFKTPGFRFDGSGRSFQSESVHRQISEGWRMKHYDETEKMRIAGDAERRVGLVVEETGIKQGGDWFNDSQPSISRLTSSKSNARKAASAHIAKIPEPLARWIARAWYPEDIARPLCQPCREGQR